MKSKYDTLGKYIQPIDLRNSEGKEENLLGVTTQKYFMPSIANTIGTDFSNYKIVRKGQFTYVPDTSRRGDRIAIALLRDWDEGLVSNIYTVFRVTDENKLLPEYLMLWFKRPEFDRYARFKSHGSVREIFDWNEMCNVTLPVPDIAVQRSIVQAYNTIERRIQHLRRINDNLLDYFVTLICLINWFANSARLAISNKLSKSKSVIGVAFRSNSLAACFSPEPIRKTPLMLNLNQYSYPLSLQNQNCRRYFS